MTQSLLPAAVAGGRTGAQDGKLDILKTPREVRNALCYVLRNHAHHASATDTDGLKAGVDPYSSGIYFDGWRDYKPRAGPEPPPVVAARTWLLHTGWRRHGLICTAEVPGL